MFRICSQSFYTVRSGTVRSGTVRSGFSECNSDLHLHQFLPICLDSSVGKAVDVYVRRLESYWKAVANLECE
jgi:hypothetical protein